MADGVEVKEVRGQHAVRLVAQERRPGRAGSAGRRPEAGGGQDAADRAGAQTLAESEEFALDAPMSPLWVSRARRMTRSRMSAATGGRPGRFG
jgi:hypothetical protein